VISVVVCTRNGARSLPKALAALTGQRIPTDSVELIVVDDHSSDASAEIAAAAGATIVTANGSGGLAAARNAGVEAASGTIVAFTDDDCEPEPDWLAELVRPFADSAVDGVAGSTVPSSDDQLVFRYLGLRNPLAPLPATLLKSRNPLYRLALYLRTNLGPPPQLTPGARLYSVAGANMAFRRRLLDGLGGFDAGIAFGGEEEDLCKRAHRHAPDAMFVYAPRAVVRHHYRRGARDTLRRASAYGRGNARQALADRGTWPIVYPFPLLVAGALALTALMNPRRAFPYLQLAQEVATMLGEMAELRTQVRSR
jgi:GT2 family glycosyltransferase